MAKGSQHYIKFDQIQQINWGFNLLNRKKEDLKHFLSSIVFLLESVK